MPRSANTSNTSTSKPRSSVSDKASWYIDSRCFVAISGRITAGKSPAFGLLCDIGDGRDSSGKNVYRREEFPIIMSERFTTDRCKWMDEHLFEAGRAVTVFGHLDRGEGGITLIIADQIVPGWGMSDGK
jgi:hypothetical protein